MTNPSTCDRFADELANFLERETDEATRATMEAHALGCADCEALLSDLRRLRIDAANLPELAPSRDLWYGIASRIDAPVIPIEAGGRRATSFVPAQGRRWLGAAAAAAALMTATAGVTYVTTRSMMRRPVQVAVQRNARSSGPTERPTPAAPRTIDVAGPTQDDPVAKASKPALGPPRTQFVSSRGASAEATYGSEISRLRSIVERRRDQLDPTTVGIIERNLKVIDDAIVQCKTALRRDPASRFLMEALNSALENKVELLRTAATLPTRT